MRTARSTAGAASAAAVGALGAPLSATSCPPGVLDGIDPAPVDPNDDDGVVLSLAVVGAVGVVGTGGGWRIELMAASACSRSWPGSGT